MKKNIQRKIHSKGMFIRGKIYCNGEIIKNIQEQTLDEFIKSVEMLKRKCR